MTVRPLPVEAIVVAQLNSLTGVPVATELPKKRAGNHIVVSKIAGGMGSNTETARFLVECYAPTAIDAAVLGSRVYTMWRRMRGLGVVSAYCDTNLVPYDAPDTGFKRYQFTAGLTVRRDII